MHRINKIGKIGRVLLGTVLIALMLPLGGCVIRTREYGYYRDDDGPRYRTYTYYYPRDGYYRDDDGRYRTYSFYFYRR